MQAQDSEITRSIKERSENAQNLSLADLARRVNEREVEIEQARDAATEKMGLAVERAIEQGCDLLAAKSKCKKGDFELWIQVNLVNISRRTAFRYMSISAKYGNLALTEFDFKTLTELQIAIGLLPDREANAVTAPDSSRQPAPFGWLDQCWAWIQKRPVAEWDASTRLAWKEKLKPLMEFYEGL